MVLLAVIAGAALILAVDLPWGDLHSHSHWDKVGWIPLAAAVTSSMRRRRKVACDCLVDATQRDVFSAIR
jgi:hypothetical protein